MNRYCEYCGACEVGSCCSSDECLTAVELVKRARMRANNFGLEFDIAPADLLPLPKRCPVLDTPLRYVKGAKGGGAPNSYSLDRIDNTRGYVRGNVAVISNRANRDAKLDDILGFRAYG